MLPALRVKTQDVVAGSLLNKENTMTNQNNIAFEVISVDGYSACFVDNSGEGLGTTFEDFERSTGLSLSDLERADATGTLVTIPDHDMPFTVGRIRAVAEMDVTTPA